MSYYDWENILKKKSDNELIEILLEKSFNSEFELQELSLVELLNRNYNKSKLFEILQKRWMKIHYLKNEEARYLFNFGNYFEFSRMKNNYYRGIYLMIGSIFIFIFCLINILYIGMVISLLLFVFGIILDKYSRLSFKENKQTKIDNYFIELEHINNLVKKYFENKIEINKLL